jgi:hypothetical protein
MPFTSVTDLPANPDVRIFFSGLLVLDPNPNPNLGQNVNTCEVFVHRSAPDHQLTIELRRKQAGKPDIIMMRLVGPLAFGLTPPNAIPAHGMLIMVSPDPQGVKRYDPVDPQNPSSEGEGFGLAIDLESADYHGGSVGPVDPLGGRPSIFLNDGIFYTAAKVAPIPITLRRNNVDIRQLAPFAGLIGANIYLADNDSSLNLLWRQQGQDIVLKLNKPAEGISYELYIINEPLYEVDMPVTPHDEFQEYYKILPQVQTQDQFRLIIPLPQPGVPPHDRGSTTTPCMPVVKGG